MAVTKKAGTPVPEEKSTALAVKEKATALTTTWDSYGIDLEQDSAQFQDNFRREDFAIPFLYVLQTNSPQAVEGDPKYIDGAKPGYILNTLTGEVYNTITDQLIVIPTHYRATFVAWVLRTLGGGFVKDWGLADGLKLNATCMKGEKNVMLIPNTEPQQQLVETMQFILTYRAKNGNPTAALMALTSSMLKSGKRLNSYIDQVRVDYKGKKVRPPMFFNAYALKTVRQENKDGKWFVATFEPFSPTLELDGGQELYFAARAMRESLESGAIDMSKAAEAESHVVDGNPDAEPASNEPPF